MLKIMLPLITLAVAGCAVPHLEATANQDAATLAKLNSPDREARLVRLDESRIDSPAFGHYFIKPGTRKLEFQLQLASAGAPGKNHLATFTPQPEFLAACLDLKPGHEYSFEVDRSQPERALIVSERNSQAPAAIVTSNC